MVTGADVAICCIVQAIFAAVEMFVNKCRGVKTVFLKIVFKYAFTAMLAVMLLQGLKVTVM